MKKVFVCVLGAVMTAALGFGQSGGSGATLLNVGEYVSNLGGFGVIIV